MRLASARSRVLPMPAGPSIRIREPDPAEPRRRGARSAGYPSRVPEARLALGHQHLRVRGKPRAAPHAPAPARTHDAGMVRKTHQLSLDVCSRSHERIEGRSVDELGHQIVSPMAISLRLERLPSARADSNHVVGTRGGLSGGSGGCGHGSDPMYGPRRSMAAAAPADHARLGDHLERLIALTALTGSREDWMTSSRDVRARCSLAAPSGDEVSATAHCAADPSRRKRAEVVARGRRRSPASGARRRTHDARPTAALEAREVYARGEPEG